MQADSPVRSNRGRSNRARTEAMRARLVDAARRLFAEQGFAETSTPDVVAAADVTRGALYHHFSDKRALFQAVVEQEAAMVAAEIETAAGSGGDPIKALLDGSRAYLQAMQAPGRTRILLLDGPSVLGRDEIDRIDADHAGRTLREGLQDAIDAGALAPLPVSLLASLLSAMFDRAALSVDQGCPASEQMAVIEAILRGLEPNGNARPGL